MKLLEVHLLEKTKAFRLKKASGDFIDIDLPNDSAWEQFMDFWESKE